MGVNSGSCHVGSLTGHYVGVTTAGRRASSVMWLCVCGSRGRNATTAAACVGLRWGLVDCVLRRWSLASTVLPCDCRGVLRLRLLPSSIGGSWALLSMCIGAIGPTGVISVD
jgi:hypothetical protein